MADLSHAIEQLRWLIEHDFKERHGMVHQLIPEKTTSYHWWECPHRRRDMKRVCSYISGVRVLEQVQQKGLDG